MYSSIMSVMASVISTSMPVSLADDVAEFSGTVTSSVDNSSSYENVTGGGVTSGSAAGASIVSPIVMFLAGLLGNVLALVVLHKTRTEIRSMMFYTLVAALTWNDLLGICLTSPPVLAAYLNERHMPALPFLCRFHALAMVCFGLSTPFIVCAMAIERSLALKCNYFYSKYCTPTSARVLVALLWAFVLFFGGLPLLGVGSFTLQYPQTWCFLHFRSYEPLDMAYAGSYALLNLLVIAVMVVCNGLVMTTLCRVRKSRRRKRMSSASSNGTLLKVDPADDVMQPPQLLRRRHHRDVELQMIWLLFAITTIFSVCWAPLMVYILFCLQSPDNHSPVFGLVAVRLASLNQTLNPWIYVILRKSLLSRLARLCRHYRRLTCRVAHSKTTSSGRASEGPRRPTGFHLHQHRPHHHQPFLPLLLQRKGEGAGGEGSSTSLLHKYVHVGHQLCPSSQFVGTGGRQEAGKGWGRSRSWGTGSSEGGGGGGGGGAGGVLEEDPRPAWSSEVSGRRPCSVCRDKLRAEGGGAREGEEKEEGVVVGLMGEYPAAFAASSAAGSLLQHHLSTSATTSAPHSCSHVVTAACSEDPTHHHHNPHHDPRLPPPSLPADGAYVDFFRHLPPSSSAAVLPLRDVSSAPPHWTKACREKDFTATHVHSFVSEADDHGYGSKVSTDSSRLSSPERCRADVAQLTQNPARWGQEEEEDDDEEEEEEGEEEENDFCQREEEEEEEEAAFYQREEEEDVFQHLLEPVSEARPENRCGAFPGESQPRCSTALTHPPSRHAGCGENGDRVTVSGKDTCSSSDSRLCQHGCSGGWNSGDDATVSTDVVPRTAGCSEAEDEEEEKEEEEKEDPPGSRTLAALTDTTPPPSLPATHPHGGKLNTTAGLRDDSTDLTSGVFDGLDDDDDDGDNCDNEDDDDDVDDDDVYDGRVDGRQVGREEEGQGGGGQRGSSSSGRTVSSSSGGTVVEDSSAVVC
ncbi:uncharacterized protein LOC143295192 [Babylonia areolata]|uniref:uncharacterized protein LOC143295192 n=1 Tax=Babylonia areolata TaxID=304850 RepID=UPI003FD607DE